MNKLLSAEVVRLSKSFIYKLGLLFSIGMGIFMVVMRWLDVRNNSDVYAELSIHYSNADGLIFVGGLYMIFAVAAFIGIFIGTEYSDGTIRNKLTVGHTRRNIYLSKFIVCAVSNILLYLLNVLVVLVLGGFLIGGTTLSAKAIVSFIAVMITAILAFTAILLLISVSIQNKAVGSVVCLLVTILMLFVTLTIWQRLEEPEYYDTNTYTDGNTGEIISVEKEKNTKYLTGTKREVYKFLNDFLPVSQLYRIAMNDSNHLDLMVIYDCMFVFVATDAGIIIFGKKNLK